MSGRTNKYGVRLRTDVVNDYEAMLVAQGLPKKLARHNALLLTYPKRSFDGQLFASEWECTRWQQLLVKVQQGEIANLIGHKPVYKLVVCGTVIATYTPDSSYTIVATGERVVEDAKSLGTARNALFTRNKAHVLAQYGVRITEAFAPAVERPRRRAMSRRKPR